jgi:hypothetical protein
MLAKQGWRLLSDPMSLCARVLKAKYFPNTDVLHVEPVDGMSYSWRSILKGIKLLKEGVIKRVGNGALSIFGSNLGFQGMEAPISSLTEVM